MVNITQLNWKVNLPSVYVAVLFCQWFQAELWFDIEHNPFVLKSKCMQLNLSDEGNSVSITMDHVSLLANMAAIV